MAVRTDFWGELKEFEHGEPSQLAFRAMIGLLDVWPVEDQSSAIAHAEAILDTWPDNARLAPWSWCKAASKGMALPTWKLARSLQLTSGHITKDPVDLQRLAQYADLKQITELEIPSYSEFKEISFVYQHPEVFPRLRRLKATDKYKDADLRALTDSPIWRTLELLDTNSLLDSFAHDEPCRIVPKLSDSSPIRHVTLRACDLIELWNQTDLPEIQSACVFVRSISEAKKLAKHRKLSHLTSLGLAFRCGFSGQSSFSPSLGNIIEADEAAADTFFRIAKLERLEKLTISGYPMGYWGREGLGGLGIKKLIGTGLLKQIKHLRLQYLPLGDNGVAALSPALGDQLESLELVDLYCRGKGASALIHSPCLKSLRRLDLSGNRIDSDRIAQIASVDMPHLESLDLSGPRVNPYYWHVGVQPILDSGAEAWANSNNARKLKDLRLSNCFLTDAGLKSIFDSGQFRNLTELDLSHSSFSAAGVSQIVSSPLWQTLRKLSLNDCRLDNEAIEALTQVPNAPPLRAIELGYNSIGPRGAATLANWSVLERVWQLNLHDNLIGDEGLIALSQSTVLSRLLELDFEQDCWNSRSFTFNDLAAHALAGSSSFPRLDSLFTGCVDEYHHAAYSPGFSRSALEKLRKSAWMRPSLKASLSDFSGISEYLESGTFDESMLLDDHDFREHPYELNEKEDDAEPSKLKMRQLSSAQKSRDLAIGKLNPPLVSPLATLAPDRDIIEGLGARDPIVKADHIAMFSISFEDKDRPLPEQVGKLLDDVLGSIFRACSLGDFKSGGGSSRKGPDGSYMQFDAMFYVSIKGDPEPALALIREALWWIGAPHDTNFTEWALALNQPPNTPASRFLQLASPTLFRWSGGYRIDRVAFTENQRNTILKIVRESGGKDHDSGWTRLTTKDGGEASIFTKYLDEADDFAALNLLIDSLTPEVSHLVHQIMRECGVILYPMSIAADESVAQLIDCNWPQVAVIPTPESLHKILSQGAFHWWRQASFG